MRIFIALLVAVGLVVGCSKSSEELIAEHTRSIEDLWACDTRTEPDCLEGIYHIGYRRNGVMYVWRKGDMMPSTVCDASLGDCAR